MSRPFLTILTTTYNRAHSLEKLYHSLLDQIDKDFEWIIVDDGSNDSTSSYVQDLIKTPSFAIKYYYQSNHGKHAALNCGIKNSFGKMIFIVDSDDYISADAVQIIKSIEKDIPKNGKYAGLSCLKAYTNGKMVGSTFDSQQEFLDCTSLERKNNNINGDKSEVFYASVLSKYPFPVFENENFLAESIVWNRIADDNLLIRWTNHIIYFCEYLPTGLSRTKGKEINNINGFLLLTKENLRRKLISRKEKMISLCVCGYACLIKKTTFKHASKTLGVNCFLLWLCGVAGALGKKFR